MYRFFKFFLPPILSEAVPEPVLDFPAALCIFSLVTPPPLWYNNGKLTPLPAFRSGNHLDRPNAPGGSLCKEASLGIITPKKAPSSPDTKSASADSSGVCSLSPLGEHHVENHPLQSGLPGSADRL